MSTPIAHDYLRNAVMQASPERLQLMLYDGAIKFAQKGREAIERGDHEQIYECLCRAQKIVLEMEAGLRPEVNAEIAKQMSALYTFVYGKLVDASVQRSTDSVDAALKILVHQRETWVMLMKKVAQARSDGETEGESSITSAGSLSVEG